jgi:hypothetical protein
MQIDFFDYLSPFITFIFGSLITYYFGHKLVIVSYHSALIYCWHTFFCITYYWLTHSMGGDAVGYFNFAKNGYFDFDLGTFAINSLTYTLVNYLYLSNLSTFLFFNIFGSIGLLFFFKSLMIASEKKKPITRKIVWIIILLPSVSYWSSAIGKDSLAFLSVSLVLWAAIELKKRFYTMAFAIGIMFVIRPHMASMMIVALTIGAIFDGRKSVASNIYIATLSFGLATVLIPFTLKFTGFTDALSFENFTEFLIERQSYNMDGDGGIDISSMSLHEKLFAYIFRPTFLEVKNILFLAAAFDNFILLCLFIFGGYRILNGARSYTGENRVFLWSYSLIAWFVLAMTTSNMGIALRQKWMFVPCLIYLLISLMPEKKLLIAKSKPIQNIRLN